MSHTDLTPELESKIRNMMSASEAGENWVRSLKVGDVFNGSWGQAKITLADCPAYMQEMFSHAAYRMLKLMNLHVDVNGIITSIN